MKRFLAILLCVLLCAAPMTSVCAAPAADAPLLDGATLVTFGDSITALSTWPHTVAADLNMTLVNSGIGGNTTADADARFERDVAAHDPDFVTLCFATNDFYRVTAGGAPKVGLADYRANLQSFITRIRNLGAQPILITPPFISEAASGGAGNYPQGSVNKALDEYIAVMRDLASANGVPLVDMHAVCDNDGHTVSSFLVSDGVHLSDVGNAAFSREIKKVLTANFRQDPAAPRVEQPAAPPLESGSWTRELVSTDLEDWLIIYPDTMVGYQEENGAVSFANTNGLWPEAHYNLPLNEGITIPVENSYVTLDVTLEAATNLMMFFNGPTATLVYANTYVSLTEALAATVPGLQTSYSDILGNQAFRCRLYLKDFVPESFVRDDGTVVFTGLKLFAVGAAGAKVTVNEMTVTVTDPSDPYEPTYRDVDSLLPTSTAQIAPNVGTANAAVNEDGSLTLVRDAQSTVAWPSVKVTCNRTIDLSAAPYLHLQLDIPDDAVFGYLNGYLYFTTPNGDVSVQLSELYGNGVNDFTTDTGVYVDLTDHLGTPTATLTHYTLSVYGVADDRVTVTAFATARDAANDPAPPAGDADGDGVLTAADARLILLSVLDDSLLTEEARTLADINGDGVISTADARLVLVTLAQNR